VTPREVPHPLSRDAIREKYNRRAHRLTTDEWHRHTALEIERTLADQLAAHPFFETDVVVFAGSGGRTNGIEARRAVHIDLAELPLRHVKGGVMANVEQLPIADRVAAAVVSVGSVINYCDAAAAIVEFARVTRPGGTLVLEFESSDSLEFLMTRTFRRSVDYISTFFDGDREDIWVYSCRYIAAALVASGYRILKRYPIHILSPLRLRYSSDVSAASRWAAFDERLRDVPGLRALACNFVFFCEKIGRASDRIR
jgi:SAM-dependent methyltransferase